MKSAAAEISKSASLMRQARNRIQRTMSKLCARTLNSSAVRRSPRSEDGQTAAWFVSTEGANSRAAGEKGRHEMGASWLIGDSSVAILSAAIGGCLLLAACSSPPLMPYSVDTPPVVLTPVSEAGVRDRRGRFREIYCAVLESHGPTLPDYRTCEVALNRVGNEPAGTGRPVDLGRSKRHLIAVFVSGIGYACFERWLRSPNTVIEHLRRFGYDAVQLKVDALSSSEKNA